MAVNVFEMFANAIDVDVIANLTNDEVDTVLEILERMGK